MTYQFLVTVNLKPKDEDNPPTDEEIRSEIQSNLVWEYAEAADEISVETLPRVSHIQRGPVADRYMSMAEKRRVEHFKSGREKL